MDCDNLSENIAIAISNKPYLRKVNLSRTRISWEALQFSDALEEVNFSKCYDALSERVVLATKKKPRIRKVQVGQ